MASPHNQDWKVVKNRSPLLIGAGIVGVIVLIVSLLAVSFFWGLQRSKQQMTDLSSKVVFLRQSNESYREQMSALRQQITNLTVGSSVDRQASEQLRKDIVSLQAEIEGLEANVRYYRRLMAPELDAKGLQFGDVVLEILPDGKQARYRVTTHQISRHHKQLKGSLSLYLTGEKEGKPQRVSLHRLSSTLDSETIPLRFKYFKIFEGIFDIPTDWDVQQLELEAKSKTPEKKTVKKRVNWPQDRSADDVQ